MKLMAFTRVAACVLVVALLSGASAANPITTDPAEHKVMLELLAKTEHAHESWTRSADPCTAWEGVLCVGGGHVNRIQAHDMGVTALPDGIGSLDQLVHLSVRGGSISRLPVSLFSARKLRHLDLHDHKLTRLADEWDGLPKLRHLDVSHNALTKLPASVGALTHLRTLNVANNAELHALPSTLGKLAALEFLDVSGCGLSALPTSIAQLSALSDLAAADNALTTLPSLRGVSQLDQIDLSNNALTSVPAELCAVSSLRTVALSYNALGTLPACVRQWTALEEFIAEGAELTALPSALFALPITNLHLHENKLTHLDSGVCKLPLEVLEVSYNELTSVPACLGDVATLAELSLVGNANLADVPPSLHHLTGDVVAAHAIHISGSERKVVGGTAGGVAEATGVPQPQGAKVSGAGGATVTTTTPTPTPEPKGHETPDSTQKYAVKGGESEAGRAAKKEAAEKKEKEKQKDDEAEKKKGWFGLW